MQTHKKKFISLVCSCVVVSSFTCACAETAKITDISMCASVEETAKAVRIYVGDINRTPEDYVQRRLEYLSTLTATDEIIDALIGFDDYYTASDVTEMAKKNNVSITRAFMWSKGETGRLLLYVEDGDLVSSIAAYKQQIEEEDKSCADPEILKDDQSFLDGKYGILLCH